MTRVRLFRHAQLGDRASSVAGAGTKHFCADDDESVQETYGKIEQVKTCSEFKERGFCTNQEYVADAEVMCPVACELGCGQIAGAP